jgi:RNA polymerase sigma-70 factor (ECF subfamily)
VVPAKEVAVMMTDTDWVWHRPAVFGAAYRILGSVYEAEDVTQEVWLRAAGADISEVRNLRAWLVTVAARISYDVMKSARVRRESYVGPWLPEPLLTGPDAAAEVLVDESVSTAMLVVMERLSPAERVALVLHDVFGFSFDRIADVLGGTAAASRKAASRARSRVAVVDAAPQASRAETERLLLAFKAAAEGGDVAALVRLLNPEAVYVADGGGRVIAARKPVHGGFVIARLLARAMELGRPDVQRVLDVNGAPGLATFRAGQPLWLDTVDLAGGRILMFRRLANPEKLAPLGHT